jgi:glycosyltransferase involved in cell wall biosynthesis
MTTFTASVIIPSHNEGDKLVDTVGCVLRNSGDPLLEIVVVDDGSDDGSPERVLERAAAAPIRVLRGQDLGVAHARNLGAKHARGDVLVFLDAHCYVRPGWLRALAATLEQPSVGLVGPACASLMAGQGPFGCGMTFTDRRLSVAWLPARATLPYAVPLVPGCGQAFRRDVFRRCGGYDSGMTRWGSEDHEICLRVHGLGLAVAIVPQSMIFHFFRQRHGYRVEAAEVLHNLLRMAFVHLSDARFAQVVDAHRASPTLPRSLDLLEASDARARRDYWRAIRRRDDAWFRAWFAWAA